MAYTIREQVTMDDICRYINRDYPQYKIKDIKRILREEEKAVHLALEANQRVKWGGLLTMQIDRLDAKGVRYDFKQGKMVPREVTERVSIKKLKGLKKYNKTISK